MAANKQQVTDYGADSDPAYTSRESVTDLLGKFINNKRKRIATGTHTLLPNNIDVSSVGALGDLPTLPVRK